MNNFTVAGLVAAASNGLQLWQSLQEANAATLSIAEDGASDPEGTAAMERARSHPGFDRAHFRETGMPA